MTKDHVLAFLRMVKPHTCSAPLIRIGGFTDGGYLVPDDFSGIQTCFSPGVSNVANFESELATKGIRSFMADYSVDEPPTQNPMFNFEKKFLGPANDEKHTTLDSWVSRHAPDDNDMILQMDIEGGEYGVILTTDPQLLARFRIIVIEFHHLNELWSARGFEVIFSTFAKLMEHFDVVHIHPNNCHPPIINEGIAIPPFIEFTFLRKDRCPHKVPTTHFPHVLDRKNMDEYADFPLPPCWYT